MKEKLFSYGTLQQEEVQLATFQRKLNGKKDILAGYSLKELKITDPYVIQVSGKEIHHILVKTSNQQDKVEGTVFDLTLEELLKADTYEVEDYCRVEVELLSGIKAWAYIKAIGS